MFVRKEVIQPSCSGINIVITIFTGLRTRMAQTSTCPKYFNAHPKKQVYEQGSGGCVRTVVE